EAKIQAERYDHPSIILGHEGGFCFRVLRHLPSVETVRVLGEMLDDMRSMDRSGSQPKDWEIDGGWPRPPFAVNAARCLTDLQLSGAPIKEWLEPSLEEVRKMTTEEYYNINVDP